MRNAPNAETRNTINQTIIYHANSQLITQRPDAYPPYFLGSSRIETIATKKKIVDEDGKQHTVTANEAGLAHLDAIVDPSAHLEPGQEVYYLTKVYQVIENISWRPARGDFRHLAVWPDWQRVAVKFVRYEK